MLILLTLPHSVALSPWLIDDRLFLIKLCDNDFFGF